MAMAHSIQEFLEKERMPYTILRHHPAYTAQEEAALAHVPGQQWAKIVICFADEEPLQAVLPAHLIVDLARLGALARARTVRLGTEAEICQLYPECEPGAMPPFGPLYGHRVYLDAILLGEPRLFFNAGTHTEAICMHCNDLVEIVKPVVGSFAVPPHH